VTDRRNKVSTSARLARAWIGVLAGVALALAVLGVLALRAPVASADSGSSPAPAATQFAVDASQSATPSLVATFAVKPLRKGAYIGAFLPSAPYKPGAIDAYKKLIRKPVSMVMWFQPWANGPNRLDKSMLASVWQRGAIPIISWEPWSPGNTCALGAPDWRLGQITAGKYDAYITQFARDAKAAQGPIMISPFHEMNGVWYPWGGMVNGNTPADLIAAWRHVHDIFVREGAANVTWVWSVNLRSRPDTYENRYAAYYPGDEYVDWVGVSGFNWGRGVGGYPWWSFEAMLGQPLKYLKTLHKPIVITETASVEQGGSKSAWLTTTFRRIRANHPEIKAVIYFNSKEFSHGHTQDWRVNSSKRSLNAFRAAMKSKLFVGTPASALSQWRRSLTTDEWTAVLGWPRIY